METFVRPSVGAHAMTLDAPWYTSADVFREEQQRIFSRRWICVGHESRIEQAGDYIVATVNGEPWIVIRDGSGAVRALSNVCRHRGTQLCGEESGHVVGAIQCPYHAWTYALDGALLAARNMQDVAGFDRADYPLLRARVLVSGGFIFVRAPGNDADEPDPLEPVAAKLERWGTEGLRESGHIRYELACNWKLVFMNYSECYHCPVIHPQLEKLSPSDSGRNDFIEGPLLGGYSEMRTPGMSLTTSGRSPRRAIGAVDGPDLARVYYYTIFPSLLLSLHPDYAMIHTVRPIAPDRTAVTCSWLFDAHAMDEPGFDARDVVEFWDLTNRQDWRVSELTQRGIASPAYRPGPYANSEGLLHAFDQYYLSVMAP
jgi:Rieske 2Fe-2S family protein